MPKLLKIQTRKLPCVLNDPELRTKGDELAMTVQEIANEENSQKQIKDQLKLRMSELESRQGNLAMVISRREEYRDVEVFIEYIETGDNAGQIRETRKDTGEIIMIRPPRDDERQIKLIDEEEEEEIDFNTDELEEGLNEEGLELAPESDTDCEEETLEDPISELVIHTSTKGEKEHLFKLGDIEIRSKTLKGCIIELSDYMGWGNDNGDILKSIKALPDSVNKDLLLNIIEDKSLTPEA